MRIQCPSCEAAYDLPQGRVVAGRAVRCARCGTDWTPSPAVEPQPAAEPDPPPIEAPAPPAAAEPRAALRPAAAAPRRLRRPSERQLVLGGWVLSVAVLLLLGWAAVAWRDGVMRAWPPSERAYAAFGLAGPAQP